MYVSTKKVEGRVPLGGDYIVPGAVKVPEGTPVRLGQGGPVVGKVIEARSTGDALEVMVEVDLP